MSITKVNIETVDIQELYILWYLFFCFFYQHKILFIQFLLNMIQIKYNKLYKQDN